MAHADVAQATLFSRAPLTSHIAVYSYVVNVFQAARPGFLLTR